jgi:hypothetical protein
MDLTLESIRRHHRSEPSPLGGTLTRYGDFFSLFGDDIETYVDYRRLTIDFVEARNRRIKQWAIENRPETP